MVRLEIDRYHKNQSYDKEEIIEMLRKEGRKIECEWCGSGVIMVHHKDCNHTNNEPENICLLCPSCHGKYHKCFPNLRYLHTHEIKEIIVMCEEALIKHQRIDEIKITKPIKFKSKPPMTKREIQEIAEDFRLHPLPY